MIFVDADFFLNFLLADEDGAVDHQEARKLFEKAALGEETLFTSVLVVFQLYWVLTLVYKHNKQAVVEVLQNVLKMSFIKLRERNLLAEALELFAQEKELDLETAYNIVYANQNEATAFKTTSLQVKKFVNLK